MQGPDLATIVITGLIKPMMLIILVIILYICLRNRSAALKHFCLMMGIASLLILPVSSYFTPEMTWNFPFGVYLFDNLPFSWREYLIKTSYTTVPALLWQVVLAVYLFVSTSIIFYLLIGFIQVWKIYSRSSPVEDAETLALAHEIKHLFGINRKVRISSSRELSSPCVWGIWNPRILLPDNYIAWSSDQKISVLMHELGHVYRYDALSLLVVRMTCAIFWFLIPLWWMARKISVSSEIACDDLIYRMGEKHVQYAEHLLQLADHSENASAVVVPMSGHGANHGSGHSEIYQRIMAVLDIKRPRQAVKSESIQYPVLIGILFVVILASVDRINFYPEKPFDHQVKLFNFSWAKVIEPQEQDDNLVSAEQALSVADQFELQPKPVLVTRVMPPKEKANSDIIEEYKNHYKIDKTDIDSRILIGEGSSTSTANSSASYTAITSTRPVYPDHALKKGITGNVKVEFDLDDNGYAKNLRILESNPAGIFDAAIIHAIKQSRFKWNHHSTQYPSIKQEFHFRLDHRRKR
jgi:bla regulator protein blaR1